MVWCCSDSHKEDSVVTRWCLYQLFHSHCLHNKQARSLPSTETPQIALRQAQGEIVVVYGSQARNATQGAAETSLWQGLKASPDPSIQTRSKDAQTLC